MSKFAIRLLTLAMFSMAWSRRPGHQGVRRADSDAPPPSSSGKKAKKKTSEVTPSIKDAAFAKGYRDAYATIYDRNDYAAAIGQLKALGHDDSAAVANLIGYSYRKLGDYKVSQIWYERALKRTRTTSRPGSTTDCGSRTGQPGAGAIPPEPDRRFGRHQQRGISPRSPRPSKKPPGTGLVY